MNCMLLLWIVLCLTSYSNSQLTVERSNSSESTTAPTTNTAPLTTVDSNLPIPTQLRKTSADPNTLTLRFSPPENYSTDSRFTHFRVEYKTGNVWKSLELSKDSLNAHAVKIVDLKSGVLYQVRIRTQRTDSFENYILSSPSRVIYARTRPASVVNLKATISPSNWRDVFVSWSNPPYEVKGDKWDWANLTYAIENLSKRQRLLYLSQTKKFHRLGVLNKKVNENTTIPGLVAGATYQFNVTIFSDGVDQTQSFFKNISKLIAIPGPIEATKTKSNESSVVVTWGDRPGVSNITGYDISWLEVGGDPGKSIATTSSRELEITDLAPGTLYAVIITSLQNDNEFGKKSENSPIYVRTNPAKPENLQILERGEKMLNLSFRSPSRGKYNLFIIAYKQVGSTDDEKHLNITSNENKMHSVELLNLNSGVLYQINVTVLSGEDDPTNNTAMFVARTNPLPPQSLQGSSKIGTITLEWIGTSTTDSHYKVDYHPQNARNESQSLCQNAGASRIKVSLRNLNTGTGYLVTVSTVAGVTCSRDSVPYDVTNSTVVGPILVYTQPDYPVIKFWKQITLKTIRIEWAVAGSLFDEYVVDVKRVPHVDSHIAFEEETYSKVVPKEELSCTFKLTQGAHYKVDVLTAVGFNNSRSRSVVIPGRNSITIHTWHRYYDHLEFPRLKWEFTTCGKIGRIGPSQLLCDSVYSKTNLNNLVEVNDGIQHWVAPLEGLYRIVAVGAGYEGPGGLGASVSGLFHLKEGVGLKIGVGQRGRSQGFGMNQGGAGGTFVVADDNAESQGIGDWDAKEAMLVAGGAGSSGIEMPSSSVANARLNYNAGNASEVGTGFGLGGTGDESVAGPGMRGTQGTGGGAGFNGVSEASVVLNAGDSTLPAIGFVPFTEDIWQAMNVTERKKYDPLTGGRYERNIFTYSEGGFGGGGAGYGTGVGGGGGYSGGGGGPPGGYSGGGGSYIKFTGGKELANVTNDQPGFVTITIVGLPLVSPIPMTLYLVLAFIVGIAVTLVCGAGLYGVAKCTDRCFIDVEDEQHLVSTNNAESNQNNSPPSISNPQPVSDHDVFTSDSESEEEDEEEEQEEKKEEKSLPLHGWPSGLERYKTTNLHTDIENDSDSLSSASSVSSMATGVTENKFDIDDTTGKLRYRGRKISRLNSSFTGFESTDAEMSTAADYDITDDDSLPPPPPTPPLTPSHPPPELVSEDQKRDFRQKLSMFHEMALRSRKTGIPANNEPSFVPSTNL